MLIISYLKKFPGLVQPYSPSQEIDWLDVDLETTDGCMMTFKDPRAQGEFRVYQHRDFAQLPIGCMYASGFLFSELNLANSGGREWNIPLYITFTGCAIITAIDFMLFLMLEADGKRKLVGEGERTLEEKRASREQIINKRWWLGYVMTFFFTCAPNFSGTLTTFDKNCRETPDVMAITGFRSQPLVETYSDEEISFYCSRIISPFIAFSFCLAFPFSQILTWLLIPVYMVAATWQGLAELQGREVPGRAQDYAVRFTMLGLMMIMMLTIHAIRYRTAMASWKQEILLRVENILAVRREEEVDTLLCNMLPLSALDRLSRGQPVADYAEEATVLFSDIKGFTQWSSGRRAEQVVEMLTVLVLEIDRRADRAGVEKIKTIGDAYWAVAGLPEEVLDHAQRIVAFGNAMLDVIDAENRKHPEWENIAIRVGVHSGPLDGGILGARQLSYEVFGETSIIAGKVEQNGIPGSVVVTQSTLRYLELPEDKWPGKVGFFDRPSAGDVEHHEVSPTAEINPDSTTPGSNNPKRKSVNTASDDDSIIYLYQMPRKSAAGSIVEDDDAKNQKTSPFVGASVVELSPSSPVVETLAAAVQPLSPTGAKRGRGGGSGEDSSSQCDTDSLHSKTHFHGSNSAAAAVVVLSTPKQESNGASHVASTPIPLSPRPSDTFAPEGGMELLRASDSAAFLPPAKRSPGTLIKASSGSSPERPKIGGVASDDEKSSLASDAKSLASTHAADLGKVKHSFRKIRRSKPQQAQQGSPATQNSVQEEEQEEVIQWTGEEAKNRRKQFLALQAEKAGSNFSMETLEVVMDRFSRKKYKYLFPDFANDRVEAEFRSQLSEKQLTLRIAARVALLILIVFCLISIGAAGSKPFSTASLVLYILCSLLAVVDLGLCFLSKEKAIPVAQGAIQITSALCFLVAGALMPRGSSTVTNDMTYLFSPLLIILCFGNIGFISAVTLLAVQMLIFVPITVWAIWPTVLLSSNVAFILFEIPLVAIFVFIMQRYYRTQFLQSHIAEYFRLDQAAKNKEQEALLGSMVPSHIVKDLMIWMQTGMNPSKTIRQSLPVTATAFFQIDTSFASKPAAVVAGGGADANETPGLLGLSAGSADVVTALTPRSSSKASSSSLPAAGGKSNPLLPVDHSAATSPHHDDEDLLHNGVHPLSPSSGGGLVNNQHNMSSVNNNGGSSCAGRVGADGASSPSKGSGAAAALVANHWLQNIHLELDAALTKFQSVVKIKTVGDVVMLAGPFTAAYDLTFCCDELLAAAWEINKISPVRAGVHVGELVGAVLGNSRLCFDIFGDTVNTASRCMTSGTFGDISVSEEYFDALPMNRQGSLFASSGKQMKPSDSTGENKDEEESGSSDDEDKQAKEEQKQDRKPLPVVADSSKTTPTTTTKVWLTADASFQEPFGIHAKGKGVVQVRRLISL